MSGYLRAGDNTKGAGGYDDVLEFGDMQHGAFIFQQRVVGATSDVLFVVLFLDLEGGKAHDVIILKGELNGRQR